ncbi:MAG: hypothetical protein WBO28_09665 [Flavobacteriales bacterium]
MKLTLASAILAAFTLYSAHTEANTIGESVELSTGNKECHAASFRGSTTYRAFLQSGILATWSTQKFGPYAPAPNAQFNECTMGSGLNGFSLLLSSSSNRVLTLGYANENGAGSALVFDTKVNPSVANSYSTTVYNPAGQMQFAFNWNNGAVTITAMEQGAQCSRAVVQGVISTVGATMGLGPIGFGLGMASMCMDLWANDCF